MAALFIFFVLIFRFLLGDDRHGVVKELRYSGVKKDN